MIDKSLSDYTLVEGVKIHAIRFEDFWDTESDGEEVVLTFSHRVQLRASSPAYGGLHIGYVFDTKYGQVTLCELNSWGSSKESRYGDVFGNCGFRLL